jgi:hypothetical protein
MVAISCIVRPRNPTGRTYNFFLAASARAQADADVKPFFAHSRWTRSPVDSKSPARRQFERDLGQPLKLYQFAARFWLSRGEFAISALPALGSNP